MEISIEDQDVYLECSLNDLLIIFGALGQTNETQSCNHLADFYPDLTMTTDPVPESYFPRTVYSYILEILKSEFGDFKH